MDSPDVAGEAAVAPDTARWGLSSTHRDLCSGTSCGPARRGLTPDLAVLLSPHMTPRSLPCPLDRTSPEGLASQLGAAQRAACMSPHPPSCPTSLSLPTHPPQQVFIEHLLCVSHEVGRGDPSGGHSPHSQELACSAHGGPGVPGGWGTLGGIRLCLLHGDSPNLTLPSLIPWRMGA